MSDGAGSIPRRFASITRRHASTVTVSPRSLAASSTLQATSAAGFSWPVWSCLSSAIIIPWIGHGNAQDGPTIFKNQTAVPFGFETRRYRRVNQGLWAGWPVQRRVRPAPGTLTFGPTGSRYPPPAAGPLLTDIRRGFKIPRTIEPAWRLILRERAGR